MFWSPTEGPLYFVLECLDSSGTDVGWVHFRTQNTNKFRWIVQAIARYTTIHTHTTISICYHTVLEAGRGGAGRVF